MFADLDRPGGTGDAASLTSTPGARHWHPNWHPIFWDCPIPSGTARTATPRKPLQNGPKLTIRDRSGCPKLIAMIGIVPCVVVVADATPIRSPKALIAYAKANPGKASFSSSGIGNPQQLVTIRLLICYTDIDGGPSTGAVEMAFTLGKVAVYFSANAVSPYRCLFRDLTPTAALPNAIRTASSLPSGSLRSLTWSCLTK
jgi:Tripartite tricarboxylate transporter family receptor